MQKVSTRFYNDQQVRAVWNEECKGWYFSAVDIIASITDSPNPRKYWSVLKSRLKKSNPELTTRCSQLKLMAADGKLYMTDCFAQKDVEELAKHIPSKKTIQFLEWLVYSENTLDVKSKQKAYELLESGLIDTIEVGTTKGLQQIHAYIFGGLYDFAGQIRTKNISKGGFTFCLAQYLPQQLQTIEWMAESSADEIFDKYVEMNVAHPFMEGNGRTTRIWLDMMLKKNLGKCIDWSLIGKNEYLSAMEKSVADATEIKKLLLGAMTDDIDSREIFMKGIDYSYYYEQTD